MGNTVEAEQEEKAEQNGTETNAEEKAEHNGTETNAEGKPDEKVESEADILELGKV